MLFEEKVLIFQRVAVIVKK